MIFQSHCAGCDRVGPVLCRTCRFAARQAEFVATEPRRDRRRAVHRPCPRRAARLQVRQSPAALAPPRRAARQPCHRSWGAAGRPRRRDVGTHVHTTAVPPRVRPGRGRRPPSGCSARAAVPAPARTRRPRRTTDRPRPCSSPARSRVQGRSRRCRSACARRRRRRHYRIDAAVGGGCAAPGRGGSVQRAAVATTPALVDERPVPLRRVAA